MTATQLSRIEEHGRNLLAIFPNATEQDPVKLCKKLRRLEAQGAAIGLRLCNGPEYPTEDGADNDTDALLAQVNKLLGNVRDNAPKTGARCTCKKGIERDNCANCEGSGRCIDFKAIRSMPRVVPVFVNRDPRGYALKIKSEWVREKGAAIHQDWGGYGIIAPEIDADGN